jgi:hypothetical protein
MTSPARSTNSLGSAALRIIWIQWQGYRYGPYFSAIDARMEGFVIDDGPIEKLPLKWPVRNLSDLPALSK